jgi:hypothetical protein
LFDDDFSRFTPEEERFESLLDFIDAETVRDDLGEVGAVLLQTPQIRRQFIISEVLAPNDAPFRGYDVGRNLERDAFAVTDANQRAPLP